MNPNLSLLRGERERFTWREGRKREIEKKKEIGRKRKGRRRRESSWEREEGSRRGC